MERVSYTANRWCWLHLATDARQPGANIAVEVLVRGAAVRRVYGGCPPPVPLYACVVYRGVQHSLEPATTRTPAIFFFCVCARVCVIVLVMLRSDS